MSEREDEDDPKAETGIKRREWLELTGLGLPALIASGCADESPGADMGGGTEDEAGTDTGDTDADTTDDEVGETETDTGTESETDTESETETDTESETDTTGSGWDPEAIPEDIDLFPRTVMAGDMLEDSFTVALFIADAQPKLLRVWLPETEEVVVETELVPDAEGFAKLRVTGLEPGTWYRYAAFTGDPDDPNDDGGRSLVGSVKTALSPGQVEPVTVAFSSCIGFGTPLPDYINPDDPYPREWPMTDMAEGLDFDLWVALGDQGYMDTVWSAGGSVLQYLTAWGACHGGGYRKIYPKAGLLVTWDDHEVVDNGTVDPWTTDPGELAKMANGKQAWYRAMPIDAEDPETEPVWRSFAWGEVVEFIVLDTRYERAPGPMLALMSDEQRDWFHQRLLDSPCRFICVCTPKPYADVKMILGDYPGGGERWTGHPEDRQAVKALINQSGRDGVVWVTGDIHMSYVGVTDRDDDSLAGNMIEVCTTSGNTNPLGELLSGEQFEFNTQNPHVPVLTFDAASEEVLIQMVNLDGEVAHQTVLTF